MRLGVQLSSVFRNLRFKSLSLLVFLLIVDLSELIVFDFGPGFFCSFRG